MEDWQGLTGVLLEAVGDRVAEQGRPIWVEVRAVPEGGGDFRLCFLDDPGGFLGRQAAPDCLAVGVVATGRVTVADSEVELPVPLAPGVTPGIRMCCLVTRDGLIGWRMTLPDGRSLAEAPSDGRLLDCLRRCLALPTPPPPVGAGQLQSVFWLSAILEEVHRTDRKLSWREIVGLHPVTELLAGCDAAPDLQQDLPDLIRIASESWSWELLRQTAVSDRWAKELVSPDLAAWMDEGMFARWILSALPGPDELVARVRPRLAPSAARRLAHAVRAASRVA
jgi:hypothetical protein